MIPVRGQGVGSLAKVDHGRGAVAMVELERREREASGWQHQKQEVAHRSSNASQSTLTGSSSSSSSSASSASISIEPTSPLAASSPSGEPAPQISTVSEGLSLALSRLEGRLDAPRGLGKSESNQNIPNYADPRTTTPRAADRPPSATTRAPTETKGMHPSNSSLTISPTTAASLHSPSTASLRSPSMTTLPSGKSTNKMRVPKEKGKGGANAEKFRQVAIQATYDMGRRIRLERLFDTADKLDSKCLIAQLCLIIVSSVLATACAEHSWDGHVFRQNDATLGMQITISILTALGLLVWYREHRLLLALQFTSRHGWFSFPNPAESLLDVTLLILHGPPGVNPVWCILTFFRCIFLFRIFKFHTAVRRLRQSQIAAGNSPSFSALFYFKTVVRLHPLAAMASIAVIGLTPVIVAYTFTERYADEGGAVTYEEIAWQLVYFVMTQQPPIPAYTSRILCLFAAFIATALFTFIFTGMLGALELDAGHNATLKKAFERKLRKDHRDAAASMIQTHYRASKLKTQKTRDEAARAREVFRNLSERLKEYLMEKGESLNLTALIYDVNDNVTENSREIQRVWSLVDQKSVDLSDLHKLLHDALTTKSEANRVDLRKVTEEGIALTHETSQKTAKAMSEQFQSTKDLIELGDGTTQKLIRENTIATQTLINENGAAVSAQVDSTNKLIVENAATVASQFELTKAMIIEAVSRPGVGAGTLAPSLIRSQLHGTENMGEVLGLVRSQAEGLTALRRRTDEGFQAQARLETKQDQTQQILEKLMAKQEEQHATCLKILSLLEGQGLPRAVAPPPPAEPDAKSQSLTQLQSRQEELAASHERAIVRLQTTQEEHHAVISQALARIGTQAPPPPPSQGPPAQAGTVDAGALDRLQGRQEELAGNNQRALTRLQTTEEEHHAAVMKALSAAAPGDRVITLLQSHDEDLKTVKKQTLAMDATLNGLVKANADQGAALGKLQSKVEENQTANKEALENLRGLNDTILQEIQSAAERTDLERQPTLQRRSSALPKEPPTPREVKEPPKPREPEVYIPPESREYPQYVHDVATGVENKKLKPIFTAFALYDLFPCIDRDGSGMLSTNEVRRITFDQEIHTAYKNKERKPWPTDQMNKLQTAVTKLFKGRKMEMNQKEFVTLLAEIV